MALYPEDRMRFRAKALHRIRIVCCRFSTDHWLQIVTGFWRILVG